MTAILRFGRVRHERAGTTPADIEIAGALFLAGWASYFRVGSDSVFSFALAQELESAFSILRMNDAEGRVKFRNRYFGQS